MHLISPGETWGDVGRVAGIGNDTPSSNVNLRAPADKFASLGPGDTNVNVYVVRSDFKPGEDDVRVYRNPNSMTEPETPTLTRLQAANLSFDGISMAAYARDAGVWHARIRMGTAWQNVVGELRQSMSARAAALPRTTVFRESRFQARLLTAGIMVTI